MASRLELELSAEDIRRARAMADEIRQSRLDPSGQFKPAITGELVMDLWDINSLQFRPRPNWLIEGFVEEKGLTIFFGPDKVGKTAVLSNFLWSYVSGKQYFLHPDFAMSEPEGTERSVIYVLLEGQAAFYDRYRAWCDVYNDGEPIENFYVADEGLSLFEPRMRWDAVNTWTDSAVRLYNAIEEVRPAILVIDTLSRSTAGMNENSPEMAQVVGWLDYVRDTLGTATVLVHHVALSDGDRPRGHSSLKGAASSYVRIEGEPDERVLNLRSGPHRNAETRSRPYTFTRQNTGESFVVASANAAARRGTKTQQKIVALVTANGGAMTFPELVRQMKMDRSNLRKAVVQSGVLDMQTREPGQSAVVRLVEPDFTEDL